MRRLILPGGLAALCVGFGLIFFGGAASSAATPTSTPATLTAASTATTSSDGLTGSVANGKELFAVTCSSCHGIGAQGSKLAPNLVGVGAATVDLWVSSGWMPLAVPTDQPIKKPDLFSRQQTLDLAAYVESLGGGPEIPTTGTGNVSNGFDLFSLNCAPCHTITGAGDALSGGRTAPPLHSVTATEVAEAVETGPGQMPRLSPGVLSKSQVNDVVAYILNGIQKGNDAGGFALGGVGPVAEGFIGLFIGVGACMIVGLWIGDRNEGEDEHDEEAPAMSDHGSNGAVETVSVDAPQFEVAARNPKRAEKIVVACFLISGIAFACFGGAFWQNADNEWLGGTLGGGMFFFGAGFVCWGKYLMPRGPFEEPRAMMEATKAEHDAFIGDFATRGKVAIRRRVLLAKAMGFAGAIFGVVALFPLLRSLGPLPGNSLYTTKWKKGSRLTTTDGRHIHVNDVLVGVVTVFPENDVNSQISQTVLIHAQGGGSIITKPGRETWAPEGYIAFSKVCTHAGCPVGLYEQETQQLLCPCHQSLFDIYKGAEPVFGPAPRPLAQLPLFIDSDGFIRAQAGYDEPIGPGFWERGWHRMIEGLFTWVDNRFALSRGGRHMLNKIFPDHWSFMIGEIALYSFIVLLATGVYLTLYFVPSGTDVIYNGPYAPLVGQHMSEAFKSTIDLGFNVRAGLLMRQMHHWSANIFIGSIVVHMLRVFFTGAFRRPREINWMVGATMLILGIFNGFLGYSLPDDLISGTGIRIAFSILESVPIVGSYLAFFLFGGNYTGSASVIIPRFFILHVLVLPLLILGLLGGHLGMLVRHKHTQFKGRGAREDNVVGTPMFPGFIAKTTGFLFMVSAITALLGAFVQINPIWLYGPYVPFHVSYAVQPDWYMGWLDGALRVMPSWELHLPGHMIPNVFFPAVLLPGITFNLIYAWPLIEEKWTGDHAEHHLLDRPRDRPLRTAVGATTFAFYFVLFGASATDVLANYLSLSLNFVLLSFRVLCIAVPIIVFPVTYKICKEMQAAPSVGQRKRPNTVVRSADGGYEALATVEYPGYVHEELEPVDVENVDLVSAMVDPNPPTDGVTTISRRYR